MSFRTGVEQERIESAYKRAVAVRRAEAAVIRAAVYYGTHPLEHARFKRLDDAVGKLLKARKEARR